MGCKTTLTEDQIETAVEQATDRIDGRYMRCEISTAEYEAAIARLTAWAVAQEGAAS